MFARKANHFLSEDTRTLDTPVANPDTLMSRLEYMGRVVYPVVFEKASALKKKQEQDFLKKNTIIHDSFPCYGFKYYTSQQT